MSKSKVKNPYQIRGFPGNRTLPDRSGLDPLDSYSEGYHMVGILIRQLFTLKLRTRKPLYLFLMFLFGFVPFILFLMIIVDSFRYPASFAWTILLFWVAVLIVPGLLTLNLFLSIKNIVQSKRP